MATLRPNKYGRLPQSNGRNSLLVRQPVNLDEMIRGSVGLRPKTEVIQGLPQRDYRVPPAYTPPVNVLEVKPSEAEQDVIDNSLYNTKRRRNPIPKVVDALDRAGGQLARWREKSTAFLQKASPASPEEALKQGLIPIKRADGTYTYLDATGTGTIKNVGDDVLSSGRGLIRRGISKVFGAIGSRLEGKGLAAKTELIDRFAPIQDFIKGTKLTASEDPYIAARNFAGHFGKVQNRLDDLSNILRPAKKDLDVIKQYAKLERFEELAGRGIKEFEGNQTIEQIKASRAAIEKKLGPRLPEIRTAIEQIRGYTDSLLIEARDAGIITDSTYNLIKQKNEKYIPLQRLEYLAEQADNIPKGSNSFNVSSQSLIKKIKGSAKEVADPIESIVRNTYKTVNLIERNRVALKVSDLSKLDDFKDLVIPLKSEVPKGMEKLSVFRKGIKEEYAIPKGVSDALKGLNESNIDIISRMAGFFSGITRAGATSLNVGFIPANAIRDFQTATIVSKVGFTPWDWLKGFSEAIRRGDDYRAFLESGASFSGFFEQNKSLTRTVAGLTEGKALKAAKTIVNPVKLIQTVGETIELAPRLGVFKRSIRRGLTQTEAAFNARNATVDFAKAGSKMKVANLWVPFLNARTQGVVNLLSAVKNRPAKSALVVGVMVELPVIGTYIHNTRLHKDIWDDIAQYEKDQNFIIIYGDERDSEGNPTQVVKIPKGDVGKVFGNPVENFLAYLDKNDPKSIEQVAAEVFSGLSPVDFVRDGKVSGQAVLSGALPPAAKVGVESATNTNLFTGRRIVPQSLEDASPEEQYKSTTSPIAVRLGRFLGVSPLKLENAFGTLGAGVGRQIINPTQVPTQVSRRFVGAKGGEKEQKDFESLDKLEQAGVDKSVRAKRDAETLFDELKELSPERRREAVQDLRQRGKLDEATMQKLGDVIEERIKNLSDFERVFKSQSNEVKAKFLVEKLDTLPVEERRKYFQDLEAKGLITEQLMEQIIEEIKSKVSS